MSGRWQAGTGGGEWVSYEDPTGTTGELRRTGPSEGWWSADGVTQRAFFSTDAEGTWITLEGRTFRFRRASAATENATEGALSSPMPAKVLKVNVTVGQDVAVGDVLMVLEAMKMEHALKAPEAGTVSAVNAAEGDQVAAGVALIALDTGSDA